jgi:hypothetical protein
MKLRPGDLYDLYESIISMTKNAVSTKIIKNIRKAYQPLLEKYGGAVNILPT